MASRRNQWPPWAPTAGVAIALTALVAYSFWERWTTLSTSPFPIGVDGYFYPIQLRSLLETGELQYPAAPFAFWLLAPFAAATDPIVGVKLGAAFYCALVALPAYGIGHRLGGGRGAGLFAASLATSSAGSAYLTNEFVKNGIGLTLALAAIYFVLRVLEHRTRLRMTLALIAIAAALLTHKMAAGLVAAVAIPAWLAAAAAHGALRGRRLLYAIVVLGLAGIAVVVMGLVAPERFLSANDAGLVANVISTEARWTAPALASRVGTLTLGHEAFVGATFAILAIAAGLRRGRAVISWLSELLPRGHVDDVAKAPVVDAAEMRRRLQRTAADTAATRAFLVLAIVIGLPWLAVTDEQALGFRLRIAAFVPMAIVAAIFAGRLLFRVTHREAVLVVLAILLATYKPGSRMDGRVVMHPALIASAQAMTGLVPDGDIVVIPERHILFMVAWYTGARVRMRPDGGPPEHRWRLLPGLFVEIGSALDAALIAARATPGVIPPVGLHPRHPSGLVLVAESTWQWILTHLPPAGMLPRWREWQTI